jgi:hypothetical protein
MRKRGETKEEEWTKRMLREKRKNTAQPITIKLKRVWHQSHSKTRFLGVPLARGGGREGGIEGAGRERPRRRRVQGLHYAALPGPSRRSERGGGRRRRRRDETNIERLDPVRARAARERRPA